MKKENSVNREVCSRGVSMLNDQIDDEDEDIVKSFVKGSVLYI